MKSKHPDRFFLSFPFLLFMVSALVVPAFSQPVTITGSAPGAEGKKVRLITWGDLITFREKKVAETPVDSLGNFSLTVDLKRTSYFALAIDLHRAEWYLEPGRKYQLKVAPINYSDNLEVNPFIRSQNLEVELINPGENELNSLINVYNFKYNQFLLDHFNVLYLERKKNYLDTFQITVNEPFLTIDNPYFQDFIRYKKAGLEQVARAKSQYALAKTYFTGQPILYQNVEYMQFFNTFFTRYLTATSDILRKVDLVPVIKGANPYPGLMKALAADSVLRDDELRELVLLKGLYELFQASPDLQEPIIGILKGVMNGSQSDNNRVVAEDILFKVTKLRPGTPAPDFRLEGKMRGFYSSLKDFRGKPVVLNFWTTFCQGCLAEMERQVPLYEKYRDKVEFVSICADKHWIKMKAFILNKPEFAWPILHYSDNTDLLVDYEVSTYPLYVVIDEYGDIVRAPAPHPSEGLEQLIQGLIN